MIWTPDNTVNFPRTTRIIDLNHTSPFSAKLLDQYGIDGAIVKISQGTGFADPKAAEYIQILLDTGRLVGGYLFTEKEDPGDQVDFFLENYQKALGQVSYNPTLHNITIDAERGSTGMIGLPAIEQMVEIFHAHPAVNSWVNIYGGGGGFRDEIDADPAKCAGSVVYNCPQFLADPRHNWQVITGFDKFSLRQIAEDDGSGWDYDQFMCEPRQDPRAALDAAWPLMLR